MKQIIRALTSIILCVALAAGLCACSWRKNYTSRKDIEPMVIEYVEDKYGFTPEITDWETEAFRSKCEHYVTLKNGNEEFKVMVDTVLIITDNYESEKIDKAVTEWIDERMPGIYYAHVQNEYFNKNRNSFAEAEILSSNTETDELTGLLNMSFFYQSVQKLLASPENRRKLCHLPEHGNKLFVLCYLFFVIVFENLSNRSISHSLIDVDDRLNNVVIDNSAVLINCHKAAERQSVFAVVQRAYAI